MITEGAVRAWWASLTPKERFGVLACHARGKRLTTGNANHWNHLSDRALVLVLQAYRKAAPPLVKDPALDLIATVKPPTFNRKKPPQMVIVPASIERVDGMMRASAKMPPVRLTAEDIYRRRPLEWA